MRVKRAIAVMLGMLLCLVLPVSNDADGIASAETVIWDGTYDTSWYDSEEAELHISTAEELAGLAKLVNAGHTMEGQTIYLDSDIYLNDENFTSKNRWNPIGGDAAESYFAGTFNGNHHSVSGLYYCSTSTYDIFSNFGLFTNSSGTIENLKLVNISVSATYGAYSGYSHRSIAGICVYNSGTISNCSVQGTIRARVGDPDGRCYVAGIAGWGNENSSVMNCSNAVDIRADIYHSPYVYVGGICGYNSGGYIIGCKNTGNLYTTGSYHYYVGGICGELYGGSIKDCYNTGELGYGSETYSYGYAGGILGFSYNNYGSISNVYNIGMLNSSLLYVGSICYNAPSYIVSAYYLSGTAVKGIGTSTEDTTIAKSAANMQKESFVESLGEAFVYNEGGYPLLAWEVEAASVLKGDVNLDGVVDADDVKLLQSFILGTESFTAEQGTAADMNEDEMCNAFDLAALKRLVGSNAA